MQAALLFPKSETLGIYMTKKLTTAFDLIKGLARLSRFRRPKQGQYLTIGIFVERNADRCADSIMIATDNGAFTWDQFNKRANQYAHYFRSQGVKAGQTLALLIENEPEMLAAFVGICKLGAIAGLVNTSLRKEQLMHCINTLDCNRVVFGQNCIDAVSQVRDGLEDIDFFYIPNGNYSPPIETLSGWAVAMSAALSEQPLDNLEETQKIKCNAPAYYIFTSGTTGLPKAAVVSHWQWHLASLSFATVLLGLKPSDRIYVCLPLFHTAAMLIGFGASVMAGSSFYLSKKFSASRFWDEVRTSQSNIFLYIGELCRYLLNAPIDMSDRDNPLTTCIGNGLRPEIWDQFKSRFGIDKVAEYYGSTEGNLAFMNIFNRDCSIGIGLGSFKVVKYDTDAGELVRDDKGFCLPADLGEAGLLITAISKKAPFKGYTDAAATNAKILHGIFKKGDKYYNTGDLIRRVDAGFTMGLAHYQFVDRIGDTFRWKGENISTGEVSGVLNAIPGVKISCVFGVAIANAEGRAGMAALVIDEDDFSMARFFQAVSLSLSPSAQPVFLRIMGSLETTDTHKIKKAELQKEAYHIDVVKDSLFVRLPSSAEYIALNSALYQDILSGKAGF